MVRSGLSIISEIILLIGVIGASLIFFLVGSTFTDFNREQAFSFSEDRFLEDLSNRLDTLVSFNGTSVVQYLVPLEEYELSGKNNRILLKTDEAPVGKQVLLRYQLEEFNISNEDFICIKRSGIDENLSIGIGIGPCSELDISKDFCANNRCIDGICTPEFGETCTSEDCSCSNNLCSPEYNKECIDELGCVLDECIGRKNRENSCQFDWECGTSGGGPLECKLSQGGDKACCLEDEIFDGVSCKKGDEGDPCRRNEECSGSLLCNPTHPDFEEYSSACCSEGLGWDGSSCVLLKTFDLVYVPIDVSPSQKQQYLNVVDGTQDLFLEDSPFQECSNKEVIVKKHVIKPETCSGITGSCVGEGLCGSCISAGRECMKKSNLAGEICQGDNVCLDQIYDLMVVISGQSGGFAAGCAGDIPNDGSASQLRAGARTIVHEMGHTLGLFHLTNPGCLLPGGACQGANKEDCDSGNSHMTYCATREEFGESGYHFLKHGEDRSGNKYYGGYSSLAEWMDLCKA